MAGCRSTFHELAFRRTFIDPNHGPRERPVRVVGRRSTGGLARGGAGGGGPHRPGRASGRTGAGAGWSCAIGLPELCLDRTGSSVREAPVPPAGERRSAPDQANTPTELPAAESPTAFVWHSQEPLWLDVESADTRFPVLRAAYARQGVRAACFVPLTTPRSKLARWGSPASRRCLRPRPTWSSRRFWAGSSRWP